MSSQDTARYSLSTMIRAKWVQRAAVRGCALLAVLVLLVVSVIVSTRGEALSVLCSNDERTCKALVDAYALAGGQVSLVRLPTSQALARVRQHKDSPEFDVWVGGPSDAYESAKNEGLLEPVDVSPRTRFDDPDGYWRGIYGGVLAFCILETLDAPTTWDELLRADLRGEIVMPNPLTSGTAATTLVVQRARTGSMAKTAWYLRALNAQTAHITESGTSPARLVAAGRGSVAVTFAPYCDQQRAEGKPVTTVFPQDGTGYEVGAAAVLHGARRHDEAMRFFHYVTSSEGQQVASEVSGQSPIAEDLEGNLAEVLAALQVPVLVEDAAYSSRFRDVLIAVWLEEARDGEY